MGDPLSKICIGLSVAIIHYSTFDPLAPFTKIFLSTILLRGRIKFTFDCTWANQDYEIFGLAPIKPFPVSSTTGCFAEAACFILSEFARYHVGTKNPKTDDTSAGLSNRVHSVAAA